MMNRQARNPLVRWLLLLVMASAILLGGPVAVNASATQPYDSDAAPSARPPAEDDARPQNRVWVVNRTESRLFMRGKAQVNGIHSSTVNPVNLSYAESNCFRCSTYAVALQLNLYKRGASQVAPENGAFAVNYSCTRCTTVARAVQYTLPVDNPEAVEDALEDDFEALNERLRSLASLSNPSEVEAGIESVIADFRALATSVQQGNVLADDDEDEEID